MKHCIVNFSDYKFKKGQDRLKESLIQYGYQGDFIFFNEYEQVGSKSHSEVPYQFKVYAIEEARKRGYDVVLYCDASIYAIKDVMPVINHIIKNGYLMEFCGFSVGQFSTDLCLSKFGLTRNKAMLIQLHSAGFTGLNFQNDIANKFFDKWLQSAKEEITFCGDWNNNRKQCSNDDRCLGHRHDQTTASIIANELQMERINPHFMQYQYDGVETKSDTIFNCRGIC
jgi:signal peptidase I